MPTKLFSADGIEGYQQFFINGSPIEEECYYNGLDTRDDLRIKTWAGYLFWGQL